MYKASCQLYNQLGIAEHADERLTSLGKTEALDKLSEIILRYNLEDAIGIRLLHNHNEIDEKEMMGSLYTSCSLKYDFLSTYQLPPPLCPNCGFVVIEGFISTSFKTRCSVIQSFPASVSEIISPTFIDILSIPGYFNKTGPRANCI
jgi:hypothetical protein